MSLGDIPIPGDTELFKVIAELCSRPGMLCVGDRDEPDGREAFGVDVASFANLVGNGATPRRRFALERDGPPMDHRFDQFGPTRTAVPPVGVDRIEVAVDRQQRGSGPDDGSTNRTPLTQHTDLSRLVITANKCDANRAPPENLRTWIRRGSTPCRSIRRVGSFDAGSN